jgi:hypothetical protein
MIHMENAKQALLAQKDNPTEESLSKENRTQILTGYYSD